MSSADKLPYDLPDDTGEAIAILADIVDIPAIKFRRVSEEDAIQALAGLILYRHLDRREEAAVNRHWETLPRSLAHQLVLKRDSVLAQPAWGVWSLSSDELIERKEFWSTVNYYSDRAGGGLSLGTLFKVAKDGPKNPHLAATILIYGAIHQMNVHDENNTDDEILNRMP